MALRTYNLYLIKTGVRAVAVIIGKSPLEAINKYLKKIGFANSHAYFYNRLMTNIFTTNTGTNHANEYGFIAAITGTISGSYLSIDSYEIAYCDDIFSLVYFKDISDPLFVRPAIEEVRKCVGFKKTPIHELRKFCI